MAPNSHPDNIAPELHTESKSFRAFGIAIALTIGICLSSVFLGMALSNRDLMRKALLSQARSELARIAMTEKWNASYGGVYVEKTPGMKSNPYLVDPDITATNGKVYTKKNPELMTHEIAEMTGNSRGNAFHITSLRPLNPGNKPDAIEADALRAFEKGEKERYWTQTIGGRDYFRYMAPLITEESCLQCHAQQGYKVGDIRGGIGIQLDTHDLERTMRRNSAIIAALAVTTIALLLTLIFSLFNRLRKQLAQARRLLRVMATIDPLTGAYNRRQVQQHFANELSRHVRSQHPLSCLMIDIDHFKAVNDAHGHQVGDDVLRKVTSRIGSSLRVYDVVGRYGGEEFLVILPETDSQEAAAIAERVRESVAQTAEATGDQGHPVTISLGVASNRSGDTVDTMTQRADEALYHAKNNGRNRVEVSD